MRGNSLRHGRLMSLGSVLVCLVGTQLALLSVSRASANWTRETLAQQLAHQENQVRSIYCVYDQIVRPTPPGRVELIRSECAKDRFRRAESFILTEEQAKKRSFRVHYWWTRERMKERWNRSPLERPSAPGEVNAFDGEVVRILSENGKRAVLIGPDEEDRFSSLVPRPITFTLRYRNALWHSEVITKGESFQLTQRRDAGGLRWHALVRVQDDPRVPQAVSYVRLIFDDRALLVERHYDPSRGPDGPPSEIHEFHDYQVHANPYGEPIWFPHKVVYRKFTFLGPNQTQVEWMTTEFRIRELKFNVDIPDEKFALHIPESAQVFDALTGRGMLEPGMRPAELFPEEAKKTSRWWIAVLSVAIVVLFIAAVVYLRRRFKPAPSGNGS